MFPALKKHIAVISVYAVLAVVACAPLTSFTSSVIGSGGDPWQTMWRFEDKQDRLIEATQTGSLASFLTYEFLGGGEARLVNLSVWPWMPLHALFGQPVTYNLVWLLSFVMSGYVMYLLCLWLIENYLPSHAAPTKTIAHLAAAVAGLMYMLLPYHVAHATGHFGAMQIQWLPMAILLLYRFLHTPSWAGGLSFIAIYVVQAWTEHHYALWLAFLSVALLLSEWMAFKAHWQRKKMLVLTLLVLLVVGVLVPYWPTIRHVSTDSLELGQAQTIRFSSDLFAYIVPAAFHPMWGQPIHALFNIDASSNLAEATQFLGIVPLLLIFFFHDKIPKSQKYFWYTVGAVFLVLSLGPRLKVLGHVTGLPLPYAVIDSWPVFSSIRTVGRAGVIVGLACAILVAWILATQARRRGSALLVGGLIFLEFLAFPQPAQPVTLPEAYAVLAGLPGRRIVEIPAATNYLAASKALFASRLHGKEPIGHIALERGQAAETLDDSRSIPAIRQLLFVRTTALKETRPEFFDQGLVETFREAMLAHDAQHVLVHKDGVSAPQLAAIRQFMEHGVGVSAQELGTVVLYDLSHAAPLVSDRIFLSRGEGWTNVSFDAARNSTFAEFKGQADMVVTNLTTMPQTVDISFSLAGVSPGVPTLTQAGQQLSVVPTGPDNIYTVSSVVAPGDTHLRFAAYGDDITILQNPRFRLSSISRSLAQPSGLPPN